MEQTINLINVMQNTELIHKLQGKLEFVQGKEIGYFKLIDES